MWLTAIKLIRTDTILDLSQKAEKRCYLATHLLDWNWNMSQVFLWVFFPNIFSAISILLCILFFIIHNDKHQYYMLIPHRSFSVAPCILQTWKEEEVMCFGHYCKFFQTSRCHAPGVSLECNCPSIWSDYSIRNIFFAPNGNFYIPWIHFCSLYVCVCISYRKLVSLLRSNRWPGESANKQMALSKQAKYLIQTACIEMMLGWKSRLCITLCEMAEF